METLWETLSSELLRCSELWSWKWSCELRKENVGSTCWQYSTTGWCIHPWPWLQWSGSGEFANFRPFFGMWQCLKVDLRFTWFTWFTILFCVLHFYILVRISSNVGFWIRFESFWPLHGFLATHYICLGNRSGWHFNFGTLYSTSIIVHSARCARAALWTISAHPRVARNPLLVAITGF